MADIEIEIDGKKLTAQPNQTVIQVADAAGIYIPRFCYHKNLSVAANCRMCLVEVEKSPKALPACATPIMPGMKVFTKSAKTIEAQRAVMEFLLINHPLDCPICDQGGECELQDLAMGYGSSTSRYNECKRSVADENLGPLIATEMTRCIYCTRCVRFGTEIAGMRELGGTARGEETQIGTFVQHAMHSEVSGNIIDLCPVGALTSKPFRFTARAFEMDQASSIGPHDCVGANLFVHTRYGEVKRVVSRENTAINEMWLSDRDRFSYTGLYHPERLEEPMIKRDGQWQAVEWQTAIEQTVIGLHDVLNEFGSDKLGALLSPNTTLEESYLLQKIMRALGSPHIDHRLREVDTQDEVTMPAYLGLNMPIAELNNCDAFLLIGSNLQKEQPNFALRVRQATLKGATLFALNPIDFAFNFAVQSKKIVAPHAFASMLAAMINVLAPASYPDISSDDLAKRWVETLKGKQKISIMLGAFAMHHEHAASIRYLAQQLASLLGATVSFMTDGANAAGATLAGAIPFRHAAGQSINHAGLNAHEMLAKPRKGYILLNVEPDLDCANPHQAIAALKQAKFVVAFSLYRNAVLEQHADIILPIAAFTETSGTFVNAEGEWQSFNGMAQPYQSSRPAWKILRVLANFLQLSDFDYESSEAIKHELRALVEKMPALSPVLTKPNHFVIKQSNHHFSRIGEIPIYAIDSLVRHAKPLQEAQKVMEGDLHVAKIHPKTAAKLNLAAGDAVVIKQQMGEVQLSLVLDEKIAEDAVYVAGGVDATSSLGNLMGEIEIEKIKEIKPVLSS